MNERAYVLIRAEKGHETTAVTELRGKQGIVSADRVFGQYDIVALIEADDLDGLIRIVSNDIEEAEHVMRTETLVIISGRKPKSKSS